MWPWYGSAVSSTAGSRVRLGAGFRAGHGMVQAIVWYRPLVWHRRWFGAGHGMVQAIVWYRPYFGHGMLLVKAMVWYWSWFGAGHGMVQAMVWYKPWYGTGHVAWCRARFDAGHTVW